MKTLVVLILTGILILAAGSFMLDFNDDKSKVTADNVSSDNSDIQKVVLGMKNYNYYPNTVRVKAGKPVEISLDESVQGCLRSFTIKEFKIAQYLKTPSDKIHFIPNKPGKYTFSCSMGMGYGSIIVE